MTETILIIAVTLLSIVGLTDAVNWAIEKLFYGKSDHLPILVVPLSGENANVKLHEIISREHLAGGRKYRLYAVDCGLDDRERTLCGQLCNAYKTARFCDGGELMNILQNFA
ncbi:MAG: hypothetical protein LBQ48_02140 [Oscillospiraceae bacterium]|jgi:hypothetical protein|nr:hypothetical protein [Oscillospiraceae bacterium]